MQGRAMLPLVILSASPFFLCPSRSPMATTSVAPEAKKKPVPSDIDIAQASQMRRIGEVAKKLGIPDEALSPFGHYKAKISLDYIDTLKGKPDGKLILVTAIRPTPAGEA